MATVAMTGLGPRIRMRALKPTDIPSHPDLPSKGSKTDLKKFVSAVLQEGSKFMVDYLPTSFKVKGSDKPSPPSAAPVELLAYEITPSELPKDVKHIGTETWFARTSIHENAAKPGAASWDEFDRGLRVNHSQNEKNYTPNIYDAHEVCNWDGALEEFNRKVGDWTDVHLNIMEMVHRIPTPLDDRVFNVLVLTAKKESEFLVVQMPVDSTAYESAKYNKDTKRTTGMYCSVERCELIDDGAKVKWQMATASDAKGALPMFIQKLGVPGAVVKDVGLFIGWCEQERKAQA